MCASAHNAISSSLPQGDVKRTCLEEVDAGEDSQQQPQQDDIGQRSPAKSEVCEDATEQLPYGTYFRGDVIRVASPGF